MLKTDTYASPDKTPPDKSPIKTSPQYEGSKVYK